MQLVVQSLTLSPIEGFSPSLVATCINASSLALLNAGSIPMTSVVCAAAVSCLGSATDEEEDASALVLDPSEAELREGVGCGCFAFSFASISQESPDRPAARLVWTNWHAKGGVFDEGEFARAQAVGLSGAEAVWRAIRLSVPQMDGSSSLPPLGQPSAEAPQHLAQSDDDASDQESDEAEIEI